MYQFMNTKRLQSCIIMIELDDKDNKLLSLGISILYVVLRISFLFWKKVFSFKNLVSLKRIITLNRSLCWDSVN